MFWSVNNLFYNGGKEETMAEVTIEDRFHGTCNLVLLHLRRAAKSNDLETGFNSL